MTLPMLTVLVAAHARVDDVLVLDFAARWRSRQRVRLASGREVGLNLPRGSVLRGDDCIAGDGLVVRVEAAAETVSLAAGAPRELARAAYHLGNRHVAVEIGPGWLAWVHDHVLDDMVRGLGLAVTAQARPFEPEAGAYGGGHRHGHGHDHAPADEHLHAHPHPHAHAHSPRPAPMREGAAAAHPAQQGAPRGAR
ncbi:MAG: urease accessory protein UreE [Gammaproteobacteria bacterium]